MKRKAVAIGVAGLCASTALATQALAQNAVGAAGSAPECMPATQQVPRRVQLRPGADMPPPPRDLTISAIPGVVAAGGAWTKVWQGGGNSADGVLPAREGGVLVAQEDFDTVLRITDDGKTSVAVSGAKGLGSISMDRQGRLYGVHRTERPGSTKPDRDSIVNAVTELAPERRTVADHWAGGGALTVRPNDLAADGRGGAFVTSGCLYYADQAGVRVVADNLRTNGVVFSPDDKTLYVTNGGSVVAFDVTGPGTLANRRDFTALATGTSGDGLAVDTEGRLYVTSPPGVQVFDRTGKALGLIPTPRAVISIAFAGPGKKRLYVVGGGAEGADGKPIHEGPQLTAATLYRLPVEAQGLPDRAK